MNNPMRTIKIEKIILSAGGKAEVLVKAKKLLELVSQRKAQINESNKRIPSFNVNPGMEVGTSVTLRGKSAIELLKRLLGAIDNKLKRKQISPNHFAFGIKEYIEIPGIEYQRDIGIRGFNTAVVFARPGIRVQRKKIKFGKPAKKQQISQEEISKFMEDVFKTEII